LAGGGLTRTVLDLEQGASGDGAIVFAVGGETLIAGAAVENKIEAFAAGDTIDLSDVVATTYTYAHGVLTLFDGTKQVAQLTLTTPYTEEKFLLTPNGQRGTDITVVPLGPGPATGASQAAAAPTLLDAANIAWALNAG
jgi:hypothetical protein